MRQSSPFQNCQFNKIIVSNCHIHVHNVIFFIVHETTRSGMKRVVDHVVTKLKQEAYGPHRSPEKQFQSTFRKY